MRPLYFLTLVAVIFAGCDGPVGPEGATGPTGPTGPASPGQATGYFAVQQQRYPLPVSGEWRVLADVAGVGNVERLWLASFSEWDAGAARRARIRVTFDGAPVPQFGGADGVELQDLFGPGLDTDGGTYRTKARAVTENGAVSFSGFVRLMMPFHTGFRVEMRAAPGSTADHLAWSTAEYGTGAYDAGPLSHGDGWVLHADIAAATVPALGRHTLLDVPGPVRLATVLHQFLPPGGQGDLFYLEGDYAMYASGSDVETYRASGTEDFFTSSYYFAEGLFAREDAGLLVNDGAQGRIAAYRSFPERAMPGGNTGLRLVWQNGEESNTVQQPTYSVASRALVLYYKRP